MNFDICDWSFDRRNILLREETVLSSSSGNISQVEVDRDSLLSQCISAVITAVCVELKIWAMINFINKCHIVPPCLELLWQKIGNTCLFI